VRSDPPTNAPAARLSNHWIDPILSARGVVVFWLLYAVVHGAVRLSGSDSLAIDDARAAETAQNFALGYQVRQPPLYEWLLLLVQQVLGAGPASFFFLRYLLIAAIGIATFAATRALTGEQRWSAAASLSLTMMYPVAWAFHDWGTHTLLLSIACIASLHAAVSFIRRPSLANAALLGLTIGLGLMAKFTYLLFLGGLLLAVASLPDTRGRLADRRLVLSCAIALLCAAPYLYWLVEVRGDLVTMATTHLVKSKEPHMVRALTGLAKLAWSLPVFLMPWLVVVGLLAWPAFRRSPDAPPPEGGERIARRAMLFAALLAAIGIVTLGVTNIGERYMHAILMIAPVYVFARIARAAPNPRSLRLIVRTSLLFVAIALVIRFVSFFESDWPRGSIRGLAIPYDALAAALVQRGVTDGTLIATDAREAGNMRARIPDLRVLNRESLRVERPPRRASDARSCVLLWRERDAVDARVYGPEAVRSGERIEVVTTSFWGLRRGVWFLARLDPGAQVCA
jgi:4-amino-4-deoxy-L-arabinose transferase-like glycosyltransferase